MDRLKVIPPEEKETASCEKLSFNATGGEYFRIWIVNILLSIVTLGIYSAWAKVRRNQYFYSSTELAGTSFEYHGNPVAILKGRIAALVIFGAYNVAFRFSPVVGGLMMLVMAAIMPWLIWKSLQFSLYNSSYRGIRFGFGGSAGQAYLHFLLLPVLAFATGFLFMGPFMHQRLKRFQHSESRFGTGKFGFDASAGSFYKSYLLFALAFVPLAAAICYVFSRFSAPDEALTQAEIVVGGLLAVYVAMFLAFPLFMTMMQNLIWNHTSLEHHRFQSDMKWGRLTFIMLTNLLGIIFTLGLYIPFAKVRAMKYRIESTALLVQGNLDEFVADTRKQVSATGEGMLDLLDFDLSM
jgi:uncharacterized membrane protein YjgN (DUF898 family)